MATLKIDLQEGFSDDTVIVTVNKKEFVNKHVRTKLNIDLAANFFAEVNERLVTVKVKIRPKDISGSTEIEPTITPYLGIYVINGKLKFRKSRTEFGYG